MSRRKSDTIEIKSDMKLKINGQTIDTRDILQFIETREIVRAAERKCPMVIRKYKFALANRELLKDYCQRILEAVESVKFGEIPSDEFDLDVVNSLLHQNRGDIAIPDIHRLVINPIKSALASAVDSYIRTTNCLEEQYRKSHYYVATPEIEK